MRKIRENIKLGLFTTKWLKLTILITCLFFSISLNSYSQSRVFNVKIEPLNKTTIYFDNLPPTYKTELSLDKKRITLLLSNCSIQDSIRKINGQGVITDVYAKTLENNLSFEILLSEKRGFTTVALPYTKTIQIEVFSWESLSQSDDLYRTGLLSYEEKIFNSAKVDWTNSVIAGNPNSAGLLGILLLKMGKINSAKENLLFAEKAGCDNIDIYAALAQIYSIKQDKVWTDYYSELFSRKSGLPRFIPIQTDEIIETDSLVTEPIEHLKELMKTSGKDTTTTVDTIQDTELNSKFKNIIGDSTVSAKEKQSFGSFPWWLSYLLLFLLAIILLVVYFYLKWRNQRIAILNTVKQENLKANEIASNPTAKPKANKFAEAFKRQESIANQQLNKAYNTNQTTSTSLSTTKDNEVEYERDVRTKPKIDKKTKKEVENFLTTVKERFPTKSLSEKIKGDLEKKPQQQYSAKAELAMHLAEEQQKIRSRSLSSITDDEIPKDDKSLTNVARQLGVEKSSLETKKNLEKIKSDNNSLSKLADKLSLNKKKE